jgi:hypothetical protein
LILNYQAIRRPGMSGYGGGLRGRRVGKIRKIIMMNVIEQIGRLINYFIAGVAVFCAYVWLFNHISTGILKHFKLYDLLLDFVWHRKEFRIWLNERSTRGGK